MESGGWGLRGAGKGEGSKIQDIICRFDDSPVSAKKWRPGQRRFHRPRRPSCPRWKPQLWSVMTEWDTKATSFTNKNEDVVNIVLVFTHQLVTAEADWVVKDFVWLFRIFERFLLGGEGSSSWLEGFLKILSRILSLPSSRFLDRFLRSSRDYQVKTWNSHWGANYKKKFDWIN